MIFPSARHLGMSVVVGGMSALVVLLIAWCWASGDCVPFVRGWDLIGQEASQPYVLFAVGALCAVLLCVISPLRRSWKDTLIAVAIACCPSVVGALWTCNTLAALPIFVDGTRRLSDLRIYYLSSTSGHVCSMNLDGSQPIDHGFGSKSTNARLFTLRTDHGVDVWLIDRSSTAAMQQSLFDNCRIIIQDAGSEGDVEASDGSDCLRTADERLECVTNLPSAAPEFPRMYVSLDAIEGGFIRNKTDGRRLVLRSLFHARTCVAPIEISSTNVILQCGIDQIVLLDVVSWRGVVLARGRGATVVRAKRLS